MKIHEKDEKMRFRKKNVNHKIIIFVLNDHKVHEVRKIARRLKRSLCEKSGSRISDTLKSQPSKQKTVFGQVICSQHSYFYD